MLSYASEASPIKGAEQNLRLKLIDRWGIVGQLLSAVIGLSLRDRCDNRTILSGRDDSPVCFLILPSPRAESRR